MRCFASLLFQARVAVFGKFATPAPQNLMLCERAGQSDVLEVLIERRRRTRLVARTWRSAASRRSRRERARDGSASSARPATVAVDLAGR